MGRGIAILELVNALAKKITWSHGSNHKSRLGWISLRAKTPEMVRKEIWAHLLAYNLIRKIMAQAAFAHGKNPRQLSFSLALQTIEAFRSANIFREDKIKIYAEILKAIASKSVGNRPGRREPKAVKRRPKPFQRLRRPRWRFHEAASR
jgi:hypothetical protein